MAEITLQNAINAARLAGIQRGGAYTNEFLRKSGVSDEYTKLLVEAGLISTISPEGYTVEQIESLAPTKEEAIAKYYELRKNKQLEATLGTPIQETGLVDAGTVVTTTPTGSTQRGFGNIKTSPTAFNMGFGDGTSATATGQMTQAQTERKSAYDLLYSQFAQYGLQALVEPLKNLIQENVSPSEFTIRLRETDAYKKRFAANTTRINQGLRALSEAEYIGLEDQYQDIMRRYGMPESYYKRGDMGIQAGFEKFIGFDVSPVELEDRIQTAQSRVFDANPEVAATLKQFYPGITNGDILAYVLDPKSALPELKRKITAAEIGAGAKIAGLTTGLERATELASYGVTKEQAQQGFQTIADILPRGGQLASIYGEPAYTQTTAEQEVFGLAGATEAAKQRRKLTSLEQAAFSGTSGMAGTALGRERAGQF